VRILLFDIETSPLVATTWGFWETNVLWVVKDWHILCFCAKWLDEKKIISHALPDFKLFKKADDDDKEVVLKLWKLLNEADIVIAHNGDKFDIRKANVRFLAHGLPPPSPYKKIDTLKIARQHFKFDSNKLDELGRFLGLGRKIVHTGIGLWKRCMEGDLLAWKTMVRYNKQDVRLLEEVYLVLRSWMPLHPNVNILDGKWGCPVCGSDKLQKRGYSTTRVSKFQRYHCQDCGAWSRGKPVAKALEIR